MIFTLSGSYIVKYDDGTLAVAQWKWKNEKEGVSYFSWEPEWKERNVFAISFNEKNELVVDNIWEDIKWHGTEITVHFTDYLTEKK